MPGQAWLRRRKFGSVWRTNKPIAPPTTADAQAVAHQQQQVQPDDEKQGIRPHPAGLRARHLATGIVSPIAIEPDDAPLDAPARADHAGVLGDGIMDGVSAAIGDLDDAATVAAWNGLRGPRPERGLADVLEIEDAQIGRPVHVFLLVEARSDPQ